MTGSAGKLFVHQEPARTVTRRENRRRWPRLHCDLPVRLFIQKPAGTAILSTRGAELNEGGIAVYTTFELTTVDQVELELTPPFSGLSLRVRGAVRHCGGYSYGLEFIAAGEAEGRELSLLRQTLRHPNEIRQALVCAWA
jgi:hypothetical protein